MPDWNVNLAREMKLTIRIYPVGTGLLSQAERDQIAAWHDQEFSELPISKQYEWTIGGHFNVLLDVNDRFAGFVGLMKRDVLFDGERKRIAGVRGLVIDRSCRKQGLGKHLMEHARKVVFDTLKADYGFLLCLEEHQAFYRSLGWQTLESHVFVENYGVKVAWTGLAMILDSRESSERAAIKEIDLMGNAF
jgi:GNAT superfamily N-acetyltransferase